MGTTGEKIAQLRKQRGFTQAKLAEQAKISTSSVAMYETNRRLPDDATMLALAKALNIPVRTLLETKLVTEATSLPANQDVVPDASAQHPTEGNWTNLSLSREEARLILFVRMHPDCLPFLQEFISGDTSKRKQIEKAWRLIQAFQT